MDLMGHILIVNDDICYVTLSCKRIYIYSYVWIYI